MKDKILNILKKGQSYSFIIFLALIVATFIIIAQINKPNNNNTTDDPTITDPNNQGSKVEEEDILLPLDVENPQIARGYWHINASKEERAAATIKLSNGYALNNGINYTIDKETEFDVVASLTGKVVKVGYDDLHGYVVEIEHINGLKTLYSSLGSVNVELDEVVSQGEVIGKAGSNNYDPESGVHVHFEIFLNGFKQNPNEMIGTKVSDYADE
ncbi:MAG TPA: M23 family metallopeptidase [Haloplasmataceae bacterium]